MNKNNPKEWDLIETCYICDWIETNEIFIIVNIDGKLYGKNKTHNLNLDVLDKSEYRII